MKDVIAFLTNIYSQQCEDGNYITLSIKGPNIKWRDIPIEYHKNTIHSKLSNTLNNYPMDKFDLYWSPMSYSKPGRKLEYGLETKFLVQDIDEYGNPETLKPQPSYIWESSPNKYQGMWELDRYIAVEEYTSLNKALATHISCDDCFDFCHVYRIPGTVNHKYKNHPQVGEVIATQKIYKPKVLEKIVGMRKKATTKTTDTDNLEERKIYARYNIPQKIRDLLALDNLAGVDRSGTIWFVENKLYQLGMTPNEIIYLVKNSIFNKYKGREDEDKRLRQELDKIITGDINIRDLKQDDKPLKVTEFTDVMGSSNTFGGWLVKGFWGRRSHGIVAGMPKCFKSTLVHDLVVSVASGKPFLGKFEVIDPGPVIMVQNENADYMIKDRTEKLILHRNLQGKAKYLSNDKLHLKFPPNLPISFINQQGFILSNPEHRQLLETLIRDKKPVLVVLDPLYLMFDGDLNSAKDLNPILNWLLYLKNEYKTSVMLIHHYNKGANGSPKGGARMMGSIILYGWVESAWYLSKLDDITSGEDLQESSTDATTITMSREFRMAGQFPEVDIHISMGEVGNPYYDVTTTNSGSDYVKDDTIKLDILNLLSSNNLPLKVDGFSQLAIEPVRLKKALDMLVKEKKIISTSRGYLIYKAQTK